MTMSSTMIMWMTTWSMSSVNPVKTGMSILAIGLTLLWMVAKRSGSIWTPSLMMMLFMGGIIMIFMILSSILPNEKSMKIKFPLMFVSILIIMDISESWTEHNNTSFYSFNTFLNSGKNFYLMMSMILMYFLGSMSILSTEQSPMRTIVCYYL